MELNGPSSVAGAEGKEAVLPPSAEPGKAVDRLADVHCLHCGYSLRGLTENRCPECGIPFDPEEMANSYLPEWPRLMVWFLAAACLASLLHVLSRILWALGSKTPMLSLLPANLVELFEPATIILIAPFAIIGLMRRIDWGRKVAIALFVVQTVPLLPAALYLVVQLVTAGPYDQLNTIAIYSLVPAWNLIGGVALPALITACVLCTGLRRRSLRRRGWDPPLLVPRSLFSPRSDWLLVLVVLLATQAVSGMASLVTSCLWLLAMLGDPWGPEQERWRHLVAMLSYAIVTGVLSGWLFWIARAVWRSPGRSQKYLKSLLIVVTVGTFTTLTISTLLRPDAGLFSSPAAAVFNITACLAYFAGCATVPYALYRYAARVLPPEAVTRLSDHSHLENGH